MSLRELLSEASETIQEEVDTVQDGDEELSQVSALTYVIICLTIGVFTKVALRRIPIP